MMPRDTECHPTPEQELLIRAAVLQGTPVLDAWREWRARTDFDALDRASLRLVPQLYRNLLQHDVDDPLMGRLKGLYRYAWSRSQLSLRATADVLTAFRGAGVETLLLKGAALAALHYRDHGARPMDDVDVLVPWSQTAVATALLERRGWAPAVAGPLTRHIRYRHAVEFREPKGGKLDLHWNVLSECCGPEQDDACWRAAVPVEIGGTLTKALCAADQLLHVCVHGAKWNRLPPIRWIADALMVLRSAGDTLDWTRVVEQAARRQLVVTTERALAYLAARFEAAVPAGALARLRALPRRRFERLEYRAKSRAPASRILGDLPLAVFHFLRLTDNASTGRRLAAFGDFLAYRWQIEERSDVPSRVIKKAARRLVRVPLERLAVTARASRDEPVRHLR